MQAYLTLTRRELGSYFVSWIAYAVLAGATFLTGLSFIKLLEAIQGNPTLLPITEIFLKSLFLWWILLFSAPIITMRLFALEKSSGTFETLMTAPVSDAQVVLAKFSAALILYLIMWVPLAGCILIVRYFANDPGLLDAGTLGAMFAGIFLLGALYMAVGCFASSLTSNQIVAAMTTFAIGLGLFIAGYLADPEAPQQSWGNQVLGYISLSNHMQDFARGVVDSGAVVFYVSWSVFFLCLTYWIIGSRRWR